MRFKSTQNIFKDFGEVFESKWSDSNTPIYPPNPSWDYSRELTIDDIDIWEVIYEQGGGLGIYAAWCPYAEFYLVRTGWWNAPNDLETYYGPGAQDKVQKRMNDLKIPYCLNKTWVDPEEMWLYENPDPKTNTLILP